jgi:hypothetical protein
MEDKERERRNGKKENWIKPYFRGHILGSPNHFLGSRREGFQYGDKYSSLVIMVYFTKISKSLSRNENCKTPQGWGHGSCGIRRPWPI